MSDPLKSDRQTLRGDKLKADLTLRLRKVEGQVRGVLRLVEKDAYCDDVIHQITAIRAGLDAVGKRLLENHVRGCLVDRIKAGETEVVDELLVTVKALLK